MDNSKDSEKPKDKRNILLDNAYTFLTKLCDPGKGGEAYVIAMALIAIGLELEQINRRAERGK